MSFSQRFCYQATRLPSQCSLAVTQSPPAHPISVAVILHVSTHPFLWFCVFCDSLIRALRSDPPLAPAGALTTAALGPLSAAAAGDLPFFLVLGACTLQGGTTCRLFNIVCLPDGAQQETCMAWPWKANPAHRACEDSSLTRKATTRHAAMATSTVKTVNEKPVARSQVSCKLVPTSCRCNAAARA